MCSIAEDFAGVLKYKPHKGVFGIEIETESLEPYDTPVSSIWKVDDDHSLRNFGREYILSKPCTFEAVDAVLDEFEEITIKRGLKFIPDRTSTSVHVHVNMQNETLVTLGNFMTIFTLFEDILLDFCGEHRRSNMFCMTSRYAGGVYRRYREFFAEIEKGSTSSVLNLREDDQKYSALNIVPLQKLGSIEVRTLNGVTDKVKIKEWIGIINSILVASKTPGLTPSVILETVRQEQGPFFEFVFGAYAMKLKSPDMFLRIEKSLWYAASIAGDIDWPNLPGRVKKRVEEDRAEAMQMVAPPMKVKNKIVGNNWVQFGDAPVFNPNPHDAIEPAEEF